MVKTYPPHKTRNHSTDRPFHTGKGMREAAWQAAIPRKIRLTSCTPYAIIRPLLRVVPSCQCRHPDILFFCLRPMRLYRRRSDRYLRMLPFPLLGTSPRFRRNCHGISSMWSWWSHEADKSRRARFRITLTHLTHFLSTARVLPCERR